MPKTTTIIESKRLAIDVINQYYDVVAEVIDKKTMIGLQGTRLAYSQSESVYILIAQLVTKSDE